MKVTVIEIKNLSVKEYLNEIKPYLRNIIIDLQKYRAWNVQLTLVINLISTKDVDEDRVMHSKSGNTEFLIYDNANDVVDEVFESLLSRYKIGLTESMRGSNFIFDSLKCLCYKCHEVKFKRGGSYIESPDKKQESKKIQKMRMINVFSMQRQLHQIMSKSKDPLESIRN